MRRPGLGALVLLIAFAVALAAATAGAAPPSPSVSAVGAVGVTVGDLERSIAFYRDVLGFRVASREELAGPAVERLEGVFGARVRSARLELGGEALVLSQYVAPRGRPIPTDTRSNDRAFQHVAIVVSDMERAYARLHAHGVAYVSSEPQTLPAWNPNAGGIKAFYFSDPDGHTLEIIWFPAGKGDPRWQRKTSALFLGIDHTALGVGDTDRSLRFYRDALGLRVAGTSENYGPEQEHLNAVFGARLRITGLRAASGPGVELLEYLSPRDGRPAPPDLHANDLQHWQTVLSADDVAAASARALGAGGAAVSPDVVELDDPAFAFHRGRLVRDPDGHGLVVAR
ncbi:MAG TPA: VOC family protein [Polyangia bacterium]|nr:VOC family protein [Polyangia bacterium]